MCLEGLIDVLRAVFSAIVCASWLALSMVFGLSLIARSLEASK